MRPEALPVDDLFSRRLIIQSGKGGTGKTTISAALAVLAASRGKRVLLVELDTHDRFAGLFGQKEPLGYEVRRLCDGVHGLNLDPDLVIVDFFKTHVKLKSVYQPIVESRVFQYFYHAAPGLREFISLGKVWRLLCERRPITGKLAWDCVIFDAPATGHAAQFLALGRVASDVVFGPMRKNAEKIRDMLRDPALTVLNIVTIPEEMPVNEAIDLHATVRDKLEIPLGRLFLNAMAAPLFDAGEGAAFDAAAAPGADPALERLLGGRAALDALARAARAREDRAGMSIRHERRLRQAIPLPLVHVPFLSGADFNERTLMAIAEALRPLLAPAAEPAHD
ncbi:MAG: ArsA family ATPase [Polyangiaceae bacterium]